MKIFLSALLLILVAIQSCCSTSGSAGGAPPELQGEAGLKKARESHDKVMVMFYAPWCPHCQDAKPKYNEAFKKITDKKSTLAYINCDDTKNSDLCTKEKIEGFPTFKVYQKGKDAINYEGDVTLDAIQEFLKNPVASAAPTGPDGPAATPDAPMDGVTYVKAPEDFAKLVKTTDHSVVFFYAPWCPHCQEAKPKYSKAAVDTNKKGDKTRRFFAVNCDLPSIQAFCTSEKVEGFPTVRYYHKGEMFSEFEDDMTTEAFVNLITNPPKEKVPPTPVEEEKPGAAATPETPGAPAGKGAEEGKTLTEADRQPEKPQDLMKGITYLSGTTADDVLKKHTHALVKFYAPWCPHCMSAKPLYVAANEELKKKGVNGLLAAINCDSKENEKWCEGQKVDGFPTLLYFQNGKRIKTYEESPPTTAGLVKFMSSLPKPKVEL